MAGITDKAVYILNDFIGFVTRYIFCDCMKQGKLQVEKGFQSYQISNLIIIFFNLLRRILFTHKLYSPGLGMQRYPYTFFLR